MSIALVEDGRLTNPTPLENTWRDRINQALEARKTFEPTWLSNLAFAAGKHWLTWDTRTKTLRNLSDVDDRYRDIDLYTADVITEYRLAALGELQTGDDRPELLLAQTPDSYDEKAEKHLNRAVEHGWDHEWNADQALLSVREISLDLGVGAIRSRFDPTLGKPLAQVPFRDGQPVFGAEAHEYVSGEQEAGRQATFRDANEGRTCWDIGSPFNLVVPPGITHERDFPWECWVRPVLLQDVLDEYPSAAGLKEDSDIGSILGLSTSESRQAAGNTQTGDAKQARLRDHVWLFTVYERPTRKLPKGRTLIFAGSDKKLIDVRDELPYQDADGGWRSGIAYFHFWRRTDSFWSRSIIEPLKDPQRIINRRKTQNLEIIDRGMPWKAIQEGSLQQKPAGAPQEWVEFKDGASAPVQHPGVGPGQWMYQDIEGIREDLAHASTLSNIRLGENPPGADTYSALARLDEVERLKREHIEFDHQLSIRQLVEDAVYDIDKYWRDDKQLLVAGEAGRAEAIAFKKWESPLCYVVKAAKGVKPRSQAAELQKIEDIKNVAVEATILDQRWVKWYKDSLDAGQVLALPDMPGDEADLAEQENHLMAAGEDVEPMYWHNLPAHLPVHREAQNQAALGRDFDTVDRIEAHLNKSKQLVVETAVPSAAQPQPDPNMPPPEAPQQQPTPAAPSF